MFVRHNDSPLSCSLLLCFFCEIGPIVLPANHPHHQSSVCLFQFPEGKEFLSSIFSKVKYWY